jgi:hypothetical protein
MINFPTLIDWIDEEGMDDLHNRHNDFNSLIKEAEISFSQFANNEYEHAKQIWIDEIYNGKCINIPFNEHGDISIESAKQVINRLIDSDTVGNTITDSDLAPDYHTAIMVNDAFWNVIVPAIKKAINNINEE